MCRTCAVGQSSIEGLRARLHVASARWPEYVGRFNRCLWSFGLNLFDPDSHGLPE